MYYYNQNDYPSLSYPSKAHPTATIATSGCGVVAPLFVVNNLAGKELYTVKAMRDLAISSGARENEGTNVTTLLNAIVKKHKQFSFKTTNDESEVVAFLKKKSGMVIINQGDSYNVFSSAGHYVVADKMVGNDIDIVDVQMYDGKYDSFKRPERIVKKTAHGCIVTSKEMGKASADRSPAYFLVSYTAPKEVKAVAKYGNASMLSAQITYADSDLTQKVGSVEKNERVKKLGTGEGNLIIAYKTSTGYKVGFIKKGTIKED